MQLSRLTPLSAALSLALLLSTAPAQAQPPCSGKPGTTAQSLICSTPALSALDAKLDHAYALARSAVSDQHRLQRAQQEWLQAVRDACQTKDCLFKAYLDRLADLGDAFASSARVSEAPMTNAEAKASCTALAALADRNTLAELALPGREQWMLDDRAERRGWTLTPKESARLKARELPFASDAGVLYKLRLKTKGPSTRFASFSTGGSCAASQVFSIPHLLRSTGDDLGVDAVDDTDDEMRWVYWGGGDYPIFYRGRHYMVAAQLANPNRAGMISWIKPDGRQRPLCLLSVTSTEIEVVSGQPAALCSGIASGRLPPLSWQPVADAHPARAALQEAVAERFRTPYDKMEVLSTDLDGDGRPETLGRFEYASGAGCGATLTWLAVLSADLRTIAEGPLNPQLATLGTNLGSSSLEVYQAEGRAYLAAPSSDGVPGVVQFVGGAMAPVCTFQPRTTTTATRFFDAKP